MTSASIPKITASVTIAPMTPATGLLIRPDDGGIDALVDEPEVEEAELAQIPVLFPHAAHHCCCDPIANLFIPSAKVFHGSEDCCCPKSEYAVGSLPLEVVPLWNKKRTWTSSAVGKGVAGPVVKSSKVMVEA